MQKLTNQKMAIDTHTHTVLSGHAFSTLMENARSAADFGLKGVCVTEHAHAMPGSGPYFLSGGLRLLPQSVFGVTIIPGMEFNIMDFEGTLDVTSANYLRPVKFGIACLHDVCIHPGTVEQHTQTYCAALDNPYIDIIGHPDTPSFPCDIEEVVRAAKLAGKLIEINNNSFIVRKGGKENIVKFARLCIAHDVRVCVSSDAHFALSVGRAPKAMEMLEEIEFPPELILNLSYQRFEAYLDERNNRFL